MKKIFDRDFLKELFGLDFLKQLFSADPKKKKSARERSSVSKLYVLIAVVAIIECLILISFTTYSWIETSSSLIIETGKKYLTDANPSRIPIAKALNYKFTITAAEGNDSSLADLNTYFSLAGRSTDQDLYRFSRASSANGKDFFFKKQPSGSTYRAGDTADINADYTYFDFTLSNKGIQSGHKYKFYFADANVFSVTNGEGSSLDETQLGYIRDAMRISFQTGTGTPKVYSQTAMTTSTNTPVSSISSNGTPTATGVATTAIQASANQRLFTIGKNAEQKISIRIWLEEKSAGLSGLTGAQIAGAIIQVNLKLTYAQNDFDYLYFDDYTFSSGLRGSRNTGTGENLKGNIGGHLTEDDPESDDYRMYFVYRTSNSTTGYVYPMTIDNGGSNMDAKCWVTCDASGNPSATVPDTTNPNQLYITALTTANNNALTYSYFAYGKCARTAVNTSVTLSSATTAIYTWKLNSAGSSETELRYNAYSATAIKSTAHSSSNQTVSASGGYGCGGWAYNTPLEMVYFRDLATGVTDSAYSAGNNFKYITNAVNTATDNDGSSSTHRSNVMFVNTNEATVATSMTEAKARATATMYYDKGLDGGNGLFKSWVPSSWLTSGNRYFHYCGGTYYNNTSNNYSVINWTAPAATKPANSSDYIYTGLGYNQTQTVSTYAGGTTAATGVGCWNAIEPQPVGLSTELIDNSVTSAFRYQIGVKINNSNDLSYYNLVPDSNNMRFCAYIPVPGTNDSPTADYADGAICFKSFTTYNGSENASWYGKVRSGSRTYYPVAFNTTSATSSDPKGYWNLGVIVDGTYEHFFWVPATVVGGNDVPAHILGKFYYNTTGHSGSPDYYEITPNQIDQYRWYVPLDSSTVGASIPQSVYFKWIPYAGSDGTYGTADDTVFTYSLYIADGIYCVITEASDNVPANAFQGQSIDVSDDDLQADPDYDINDPDSDTDISDDSDDEEDVDDDDDEDDDSSDGSSEEDKQNY